MRIICEEDKRHHLGAQGRFGAWCSRAIAWEIMAEQGAFKFKYEGVNRAGKQEVSSLADPS